MRRLSFAFAAMMAFAPGAQAAEQVRVGVGYGLAFLPIYICEDLKLLEKYGKADHLDIKAGFTRFQGSGAVQDGLNSGSLDIGPYGVAPFLANWEKEKDSPKQAVIVSGLTTMPLTLLSDRPKVATFSDLGPTDRIAMPSASAPQMFMLQMQALKTYRKADHFDAQVMVLPPADALSGLINGDGMVTAYFASPPYTQLALRDSKVHAVLSSAEVFGGKVSFMMMGASHAYVAAHPQISDVLDKAIDEAARIIHDDPRRASQIYLTHEPSGVLNGATVEAVLRQIGEDFGSGIYGVKAYADFMVQQGALKESPRSWRYIVAPSMMNWPRS